MDNEVVIKVTADDDTDRGFASARGKGKKFADDIGADIKKVGPGVGSGLGGGMIDGLKSTLPSFGQFGAVAGGILAPVIGGLVAAGVAGVAGGAGILGGLTIAAKDPAVQQAASNLGTTVGAELKGAAQDFVPVALESLGKVQAAWHKVLPDVKAIFQDSSSFVDPLLDGLLSGAQDIVGAVRNVVANAQPTFEAFGRMFGDVQGAVADIFNDLADDSVGAAGAVDDLTMALTNTLDVVGKVVNALAEFKTWQEGVDAGIDSARYSLEDQVSWLDLTADGYDKGSTAAQLYRDGLIGASGSSNDYAHYLASQKTAQDKVTVSTEKSTSALQALGAEMLAQTDPLFGLINATETVSDKQDAYNEALKKHGPKSQAAREALADLGQAALIMNGKVGAAAEGFDGSLTPAMRTAFTNAGLTKGQINKLEGQLRSAHGAAVDWAGEFTQTFTTKYKVVGSRDAAAYNKNSQSAYAHGGIVGGSASGASPSGLTMVGEHGPELLDLPAGTSVKSNPDTMRMMGGQGGGAVQVIVSAAAGASSNLVAAIMESLRFEVRTQGNGSAQQTFGVAGVS